MLFVPYSYYGTYYCFILDILKVFSDTFSNKINNNEIAAFHIFTIH